MAIVLRFLLDAYQYFSLRFLSVPNSCIDIHDVHNESFRETQRVSVNR